MKFRNLLFGTMVACAFVACSNENDPVTGEPVEPTEADATLSVKINSVETKAADATDATITNLNVIVFNGTGASATIESIGTSETTTTNEVLNIPVKGGNKSVVVLANYTLPNTIVRGASYGAVLSLVKNYDDKDAVEDLGLFTMNSKKYDITVTSNKENYLGYNELPAGETNGVIVASTSSATTPVKLYRNVAKVNLEKVTVAATGGDGTTTYPDAALKVKEVFILHANKTTKLFGDGFAEWGATNTTNGHFLNAATQATYEGWLKELAAYTPVFTTLKIADVEEDAYTSFMKTIENGGHEMKSGDSSKDWAPAINFYVYENQYENIQTLLVVKGDFSYTGNITKKDGSNEVGTVTEKDRYYTLAVGYTGFENGTYTLPGDFKNLRTDGVTTASNVLRNLEYKLTLNVTGPGYTTPFGPKPFDPNDPNPDPDKTDTHLNVKCEVVEFGAVSQIGGIE